MSGPKLSAYELEQIRKAELERIQREIANLRANIVRMQQEAQEGVKWCEQNLLQINRQLSLVASSTLSPEQVSYIKRAILTQQQRIIDLKYVWSSYEPLPSAQSDSLEDVKSEENRLASLLEDLKKQQGDIAAGSPDYFEALRLVADDAKKDLVCTTLSFAEAMRNIPKAVDVVVADDDVTQLKNCILDRIAELKSHELITQKMDERLENVAKFVEQETDITRLKELNSLVVGDIATKLHKIEAQYDDYLNAQCQHVALLASLGEAMEIKHETFETPENIKATIAQLIDENRKLQIRILQRAERKEIEKSIDKAMDTLGYHLIGEKCSTEKGSIKLYNFSDGTGIQVTQRADGVIRMKVVGIGHENQTLDDSDKLHLVKMQEAFCDTYEEIVEAFKAMGVCQVKDTEIKYPPDVAFAEAVDVIEYDSDYFKGIDYGKASGANVSFTRASLNKNKKNNRTSVQKPLHLAGDK